jgi:hypothetical protein
MTGITFIAIAFSTMLYLEMFDNLVLEGIACIYLVFGMVPPIFSEQIVKIRRKLKKDKNKRKMRNINAFSWIKFIYNYFILVYIFF